MILLTVTVLCVDKMTHDGRKNHQDALQKSTFLWKGNYAFL